MVLKMGTGFEVDYDLLEYEMSDLSLSEDQIVEDIEFVMKDNVPPDHPLIETFDDYKNEEPENKSLWFELIIELMNEIAPESHFFGGFPEEWLGNRDKYHFYNGDDLGFWPDERYYKDF